MLTEREIDKLREIRRLMTLETARFREMWDDPERHPLPKCEAEVDAFIRERTRIFRETWILSELDDLLGEDASS
jgi:hypothetical protein